MAHVEVVGKKNNNIMIKELYETFSKLNEQSFIDALYSKKIDDPKHIEKLQKVLELMGVEKSKCEIFKTEKV